MERDTASFARSDGFKRQLAITGALMLAIEFAAVVLPVRALFRDRIEDAAVLIRAGIPVAVAAEFLWFGFLAVWLAPVLQVTRMLRNGHRPDRQQSSLAYRGTTVFATRALAARGMLWGVSAFVTGAVLTRYSRWTLGDAAQLGAAALVLGLAVNVFRAAAYTAVMRRVRTRMFSQRVALERIVVGYRSRLGLGAISVTSVGLVGVAAFLYYSRAVVGGEFLELWAALAVCLGGGALVWSVVVSWPVRRLGEFCDRDARHRVDEGVARDIYRRMQALPYRLSGVGFGMWIISAAMVCVVQSVRSHRAVDDIVVVFGVMTMAGVGASIFTTLWYRDAVRPVLQYITSVYRLPIDRSEMALSLRGKLFVSFGGLVTFACGAALFWGFVQYKGLVSEGVASQARLTLALMQSRVQARGLTSATRPDPALVRSALSALADTGAAAGAVFYYVPSDGSETVRGPDEAPPLPWYARDRMSMSKGGDAVLSAYSLAGKFGRLSVGWRGRDLDLGVLAVLYPDYRGTGPSIVRPLKELVAFFLVLFAVCAGTVVWAVSQVVRPIRQLEERAEAMAQGELGQPVVAGGEADEIGRLTFALEEMRRALRDKLRSTEEINLDLERAVQKRTADLARKNRELAEALEKLTRAQDQLVRSEKMASIGQLVAGIAHEINNPVNAIVNTVGPLEEAIEDTSSDNPSVRGEAVQDVRDMLRVVRSGADRTKAIVRALHNYSRSDDENVVDVDLNYSIDDSLQLLRHITTGSIDVERDLGDIGRIRGHAGQLGQVFMNLLTNAAQAVGDREGGQIRVVTRTKGDSVEVVIADNGSGIPPDVLPRIFDPFFTTKDVGEGSGLGLSIVHGIVERHGGTISVTSSSDTGTVFTVILPRVS